jgi:SOS-response transcriptional repressor LexA
MAAQDKLPPKLQEWVEARKRHRLSHMHVQMARELGFAPKSLRKIDDSKDKRWKAPLPQYLEFLNFKRFGRERPEVVRTIEQTASAERAKEVKKKAEKAARRGTQEGDASSGNPSES